MRFEVISLIIFLTIPGYQAYNCTSCEDTTCPPILFGCKGHRAIDPCGCCEHCARGYMEPCGGENWEIGYCNDGLKCAAVNGTGLAEIPNIGICRDLKEFPLKHYFEDNDEICPIRTGCYRAVGHCDCITKHTCILDFFQYSEELCNPMIDFLNRFNEPEGEQRYCFWRGCDITDGKCACESGLCDYTRRFQFRDIWECNKGLVNQKCSNVTCPEVQPIECPNDSTLSNAYTPQGDCCPKVPSFCTCDFNKCNNECPRGRRKVMIWKSNGIPGSCCDRFLCLV
ncbi:cysteine-rich motor neuron 1 protein-like [Xenopus laevis]|uniref:IGFBP N-terminal domain-containing protein n=2 Tax=Xenopus laevis TaxID=8355 RepID=A0A974CGA8_XENLA|nr:cysteine-rich motor neuron 1 protein-like [Xenopus laevis]OCT72744.1 hypothetical protein XELAEV_18035727mg [Xenopus laevis]